MRRMKLQTPEFNISFVLTVFILKRAKTRRSDNLFCELLVLFYMEANRAESKGGRGVYRARFLSD